MPNLVVEETFGPVAPVIRAADAGAAIDIANSTQYGLQAGVLTSDLGAFWQIAAGLQVGAVNLAAGPHFDSPHIPFGGVKASGIGREGIRYSIREMSVTKTITFPHPAALGQGGDDPPVPGTWTGGIIGDRLGREMTAIAMMAISALCCLLIGLTFRLSLLLLIVLAIIWGYSIIGDSVQFSALATENADPVYVGSALTLQMAFGFFLSGFTIWLIPIVHGLVGWEWTFAVLAPGPALGIVAMWRALRHNRDILAGAGPDK